MALNMLVSPLRTEMPSGAALTTDYYIKLNPGMFVIGGSVVNAAPEGISVRKGDTSMFNAIQTAFQRVRSDGTYNALFKKWGLNDAQKISLGDRRTNYA